MYNDDTRGLIYGTIVVFLVGVLAWLGIVYISACSFTLNCLQGAPLIVRTPIPTLIPLGEVEQPVAVEGDFNKCQIGATDLIGAWVSAGHSETDAFPFTDLNGQNCEATYEDIQPLLRENSIWFPGSLGCISCHNADQTDRNGGLDLSTYEAMSANADLFGDANWEGSMLYEVLVNQGLTAQGHSPDAEPRIPILYVGQVVGEGEMEGTATAEATPTP
jgi:hypothetical protein